MKIYLAGDAYRSDILKIYLAGNAYGRNKMVKDCINKERYQINILETFYTINAEVEKLIPLFDDFMLDSGAFSFISSNDRTRNINWDDYIQQYANCINRNDIKLFFELDIDNIVGYNEVKRLRKKLEKLTDKKCIPVWHRSRGLAEYKKLVNEYDYIAIGGIAIKAIKKTEYKYFTELLKIAHENNCKVHGLGFTNLKLLKKYHFDSVDSSSWTCGNRYGYIYKFNGKTLDKIKKPENSRVIAKRAAINNFIEWCKFAKYADKHL